MAEFYLSQETDIVFGPTIEMHTVSGNSLAAFAHEHLLELCPGLVSILALFTQDIQLHDDQAAENENA